MKKSLRFYIESEQHKKYENLSKSHRSFLQGKRFADIFLLASLLGYRRGVYEDVKKRKEVANTSVFSDEELWIFRGLAFIHQLKETNNEEEALKVLLEEKEVFKIAEGYAKSGLKYLEDIVFMDLREKIEDFASDILNEICSDEIVKEYVECD